MKNYEEMAETVFRRIDEYKEAQRKKRKAIYTTAASLACAALVTVMGFVVWKNGNLEPSGGIQGITPTTNGQVATEPTQNVPIGGSDHCEMHFAEYHSIPTAFIDYVGESNFQTWKTHLDEEDSAAVSPNDYCTAYNIKRFIDDFNLPKSIFEDYFHIELPNNVHDSNLLYSDDTDAIEAYYRDVDSRYETVLKHDKLSAIKVYLIDNYHDTTLSEILIKKKAGEALTAVEEEILYTQKVSLMRLIQVLDINKTEFTQAYDSVTELLPLYDIPDYDYQLDLVYNEDGSLKDFTIDDNLSVVEQDALFAGVDNFFTD